MWGRTVKRRKAWLEKRGGRGKRGIKLLLTERLCMRKTLKLLTLGAISNWTTTGRERDPKAR